MPKGPLLLSTVAIVFLFVTGQPFYALFVLAVLVFALIYKFFEAIIKGGNNSTPRPDAEPVSPPLNESDAVTLKPQKTIIPKPIIERNTNKEKFCAECGSQRVNKDDLFCVTCGSRFDSITKRNPEL